MRILATSDLHGHLPDVPECDLFIIGGDVCPVYDHSVDYQLEWLDEVFSEWLAEIPARWTVGIAGNHDFVFEYHPIRVVDLELSWIYLEDSSCEINGVSIYGLPWVPNLPNWAFHASRDQLALRYNAVPKGTDIVISHGPPFGLGDYTVPRFGSMHVGAKSANDMMGRVNPKALICGHIHEGFGLYKYRGQHGKMTDVYNVSLMDENYVPRYVDQKPHIVEIMLEDAQQEQTDGERTICDSDTDVRLAQEPAKGSHRSESSVVDPIDPDFDSLAT